MTVDLGLTGTAAATDYAASSTQLVIAAGSTSGTATITAVDDAVDEPDGRFAKWIDERGAEGLHHICYEVDDIDAALAHAQAQGATLRICQACQVHGSHPHPEGWVAFLDDEAGGIEIEFMQVYTPEQLKEYEAYKGI